MRSTFWMKVPSGLPGLSPSFWNCCIRYATAFSSPGVPGARPSIESAERSLMCCMSDAVSIACAAAVTAALVAVVSVKAAGTEEPDDVLGPLSRAHAAIRRTSAATECRRRVGTMTREKGMESYGPADKSSESCGMRQVPDERYCSFHKPLTLTCPMTDHRPSAQSPRPGVTLIAAAALGATLACGGRDGAAKDSTRVAADSSRATSCTGDKGG